MSSPDRPSGKSTLEIPPGMTGIQLISKDPSRFGSFAISQFLEETDDEKILRSVVLDPHPSEISPYETDRKWWAKYGRYWEGQSRMQTYLPRIARNENSPPELLLKIVETRVTPGEGDPDKDLEGMNPIAGGIDDPALDVKTGLLAESKNWMRLA